MNWRKFPFPLIVTMVYVVLGTWTGLWDKAWVIYLTIPIYYSIVSALRGNSKKKPVKANKHDDWSNF